MTPLESDFHAAMLNTYDIAKANGYRPTYFLQMVQQYGGVAAAKRLLAKHEIRAGLMTLREHNLFDASMEALVIQERFASLFTPEEIAEARWRLDELR